MVKKRRLQIQTRSDVPFEIYLPSDEGITDINSADEIAAYKKEDGALRVDDGCTPFLIRAISYREAQDLIEKFQADNAGVISTAAKHVKKEGEGEDAKPLVDVSNMTKEDIEELSDATETFLKMRLDYVKLGFKGIPDYEEPDDGWPSIFDPDNDTGIGTPVERAALADELGAAIQRAADLGPKAERFFKPRYGYQTMAPVEERPSHGDVKPVSQKIETSAETAEGLSSQG